MKFPRLFKKTSTGAIQFWDIEVEEGYDYNEVDEWEVGRIKTTYGQLDTDSPQETIDTISSGKNEGKKNATTPFQQANAEAQAKWEKQKKKGYVESIKAAESDELDALIEGGIVPMLAHKFTEQGHKIKFPAYVQPKLDGIRCIAMLRNGKCTLWSRTRKPIKSMPHIVAEIEAMNISGDMVLDGELYNHEYKSSFEHIVSMVRQDKKPDPRCTDVQYHIYDVPDPLMTFDKRWKWLNGSWNKFNPNAKYLNLVETHEILDTSEILFWFNKFRKVGYEGAMLRNAGSKYLNKRSYDLQKVKEMEDSEFEIIGIEEGRGKLSGHVGAFVCKMSDGKEFLAKMSGDTDKLKEYFENHRLWKGKQLTVKYQGLTGTNGVPRFPVGISIRDYE